MAGSRVGLSAWFRPLSRRKYLALYTALFTVMFVLVFFWFPLHKRSNIWRTDTLPQFFAGLLYLKSWVSTIFANLFSGSFSIPIWDLTIGHGQDVHNVLSFRPLTFLSLLFPEGQLELYAWLRLFIALYLAGLFFALFIKELGGKLSLCTIVASFVYVFSGSTINYFIKHFVFQEALFYLPLFLAGTERLLRGKRPWIFVASVSLCGLSYFYNLYLITIIGIVYAFVRFMVQTELRGLDRLFGLLRVVLVFLLWYMLGVCIAAVSLLPNLLLSMQSSRGIATPFKLLYEWNYYADLFTSLSSNRQVGIYGYLAIPTPVLLLVLLLCLNRDTVSRKVDAVLVACSFVSLALPIIARFLNGFAAVTNRWSFAISFLVAVICAREFSLLQHVKLRTLLTALPIVLLYAVFLGTLSWLGYKTGGDHGLLLLCGMLVLFLVAVQKRLPSEFLFGGMILVEIVLFAAWTYSGFNGSFYTEFANSNMVLDEVRTVTSAAAAQLNPTGRVDAVPTSYYYLNSGMNYGIRSKVAGLSSYYSFSPASVTHTALELGNSQIATPIRIKSNDHRTVLDELAAVQYVTARDSGTAAVPYGFVQIGRANGVNIYQNAYALPLMYGYTRTVSSQVFDPLNVHEKEWAMIQGAVVDGARATDIMPSYDYEMLATNDVVMQELRKLAELPSAPIVFLDDHTIYVKSQATVSIPFRSRRSVELSVLMEGLSFKGVSQTTRIAGALNGKKTKTAGVRAAMRAMGSSPSTTASIVARTRYAWGKRLSKKRALLLDPSNQYYYGARDMKICLGYTDYKRSSVELQFKGRGYYTFDSISIIAQPMDNYDALVNNIIRADQVSVETNTVHGQITMPSDGVVCVAIPYSAGWSATVDGVKAKLINVNREYIGLDLPSGSHDVRLTYSTPGLLLGAVISILSTLGVCAIVFFSSRDDRILGRLIDCSTIIHETM